MSKLGRRRRFGRLKILEVNGRMARCRCSCGQESTVSIYNLLSKATSSCGCLHRELLAKRRFSGFGGITGTRWHNIRCDAKKRGHELKVSIEDIWELFVRQKGRCALTGLELSLLPARLYGNASLDRKDSKRGYVRGNLQWVHREINLMKNVLPMERFVGLCRAVVNHLGA